MFDYERLEALSIEGEAPQSDPEVSASDRRLWMP